MISSYDFCLVGELVSLSSSCFIEKKDGGTLPTEQLTVTHPLGDLESMLASLWVKEGTSSNPNVTLTLILMFLFWIGGIRTNQDYIGSFGITKSPKNQIQTTETWIISVYKGTKGTLEERTLTL